MQRWGLDQWLTLGSDVDDQAIYEWHPNRRTLSRRRVTFALGLGLISFGFGVSLIQGDSEEHP